MLRLNWDLTRHTLSLITPPGMDWVIASRLPVIERLLFSRGILFAEGGFSCCTAASGNHRAGTSLTIVIVDTNSSSTRTRGVIPCGFASIEAPKKVLLVWDRPVEMLDDAVGRGTE